MKRMQSQRAIGFSTLVKHGLLFLTGCYAADAMGGAAGSDTTGMSDTTTVFGSSHDDAAVFEGTYRGVLGFGEEGVTAEKKDGFSYRFGIHGEERCYPIDNGAKPHSYSIQNRLHIGYSYRITVENGKITAVSPLDDRVVPAAAPAVPYVPGERTLKNFLTTALAPMGTTLYVFGGGWNWQDDAGAVACGMIGLSPTWSAFFEERDASYTYRGENRQNGVNYYPVGDWNEYYFAGLDCSGYVGWVLYNTLHAESGLDSYVMSSTKMASTFAGKGWGTFDTSPKDLRPGDIVSIRGHVWVCLGRCEDGSMVIAHSTPSDSRDGQPGGGVQLTALGESRNCQAYALTDRYMSRYFPTWYQRYSATLKSYASYTDFAAEPTGRFSWNLIEGGVLTDPDGIADMTADRVLALLFDEE